MAVWEKKKVVFVVEGTAVLGYYWPTILNTYLKVIIRHIRSSNEEVANDYDDEESLNNNVEFAIVVFDPAACGSSSSSNWLFHQTSWTNDVKRVMNWLSDINFSSNAAFSDDAAVQGLLQALMMFRSSNQSPNDHKKHCFLVAERSPDASSPDVKNVVKLLKKSNVHLSSLYITQVLTTHRLTCNVNPADTGAEIVTQSIPHSSLTAGKSKFDQGFDKLVWMGDVYAMSKPKAYLITTLHAFMRSSASSKLVEDWPLSIEIDYPRWFDMEILKKKVVGNSRLILFHAMRPHATLTRMQKENLCGVVKLPSQLMIFIVTSDPSRFFGLILPETPEQQEILFKKWKEQANTIITLSG